VVSSTKSIVRDQFEQNKIGWKKSLLEGFSQDDDGNFVPWMTYPAIEFLKNNLKPEHEIFEFGCGASTLFFSKRVKKVVGLETNPRWLGIINEKLQDDKNWTPSCDVVTSDSLSSIVTPSHNVKINLLEDGLTNPAYENFAKNCGQKFDFIIIDSLKRFECAKNVIDALKPNGTIILDDSERKNYKKIFDFFTEKGFQQTNFFGIAPGQLRIKNTTFFNLL